MSSVTEEEDLVSVVGYRFCPTDEELVNHYLKLKNQGGQDHDVRAITVVNVCKSEPWDLPGQSKIRSEDLWYFFSRRNYKYGKSKRSNRATDAGYWKPTGNPRKVMAKGSKKQIGTKRTLVFFKGRPKGISSEWVMHQYERSPDSNLEDQGEFVLCKLKRKSNKKTGKGVPNDCIVLASDFQNQHPIEMASNSVFDEHQLAHHMAYDAENECPNDVTAKSTDANGFTSCLMASYFENQISVPVEGTLPPPMMTDFEHQSPYMGGDCLLISSFEDLPTCGEGECPPMVTPTDYNQSSYEKCGEGECPIGGAPLMVTPPPFEYRSPYMGGDCLSISSFGNLPTFAEEQCPPMVAPTDSIESSYEKCDWLSVSDFKNQLSACGEGILPYTTSYFDFENESPNLEGDCLMASGYKKQISAGGEGEPPPLVISFEDCLKTSYLGSKVSYIKSEEGQQISYFLSPSCFEDLSTFNEGEPNSLLAVQKNSLSTVQKNSSSAYDLRKINSIDKTNISVSEEGESSSLQMLPSDFASQNQFQKIDMIDLEDFDWDRLMDFDVQTAFAEG